MGLRHLSDADLQAQLSDSRQDAGMALVSGHFCAGARWDAELRAPRFPPQSSVPQDYPRAECTHTLPTIPAPEVECWPDDDSIQAATGRETGLPFRGEHVRPSSAGSHWPAAGFATRRTRHHVLRSCKKSRAAKSSRCPRCSLVRPWLPRPARHQAQMTVAAGSPAWQLRCR